MLHTQEVNDLRIKNPEGEDTENMNKGLAILKEAMTDLKIILGYDPAVIWETPRTGSGAQSSQSQKESEETELAKSTDESAPPSKLEVPFFSFA